MPLFLSAAGLDKAQIGIVAGVGTGAALLIQPVLGRWAARSGSLRVPLIFAALSAASGYFLFGFAHGMLAFTVLAALGVNGFLFLNAAGGTIAGHLAGAGESGATYARFRVWGSIGYLFVAVSTGLLLNYGSGVSLTRSALAPVFHWGPLLLLLIALLVPLLPDSRHFKTHPVATAAPRLRAFFTAYFLFFFAFNAMLSMVSLYLQTLGATPLWITGTWAAGVAAEAWMMTRIGRWSDQHGRRPALLLAFLALPLRCLLLIVAPSPPWVLAVQLSEAFCFGIIGILGVTYINDVTGDAQRGAAQAKLAGLTGLAMCLGPLVAGAIAEAFSIRAVFACMAGVAMVGAFIFSRFVPESHHAQAAV
jgi:PPP family 3-phenylpropionic acid transporter